MPAESVCTVDFPDPLRPVTITSTPPGTSKPTSARAQRAPVTPAEADRSDGDRPAHATTKDLIADIHW